MIMDSNSFVQRWAECLERGAGAVFLGAGLSCGAGYPTWQKLLLDIARELGLDIEQEHDLAGVAQYSLNRENRQRHKLSALIAQSFPPKAPPETFRILARLPLRHIWTTNYDKLAETAWAEERKSLDVKSQNDDLGIDKPWAHGVLYKMHGTIDHPRDVVIAKDDYELYRRSRAGFLQVLAGHLVSRQFLFLGFSFTDPNLAHLFASIRETFRDNGPEHYAIVRRPKRGTGRQAGRRFRLDKVRHALWVEDLKRYGIQCVEIDEFDEIDLLLKDVENCLARRSVFVSGSFPDAYSPSDLSGRKFVEDVAHDIGVLIAKKQKRLVSGFGLVVGNATMAGTLSIALADDTPNLEKSILLRPFPQTSVPGLSASEFKRRYRESMVRQAGVCIFIAGIKDEDRGGNVRRVDAPGVKEEFETAKRLERMLIPIGATGGAAEKLWELVERERQVLSPGASRKDFSTLKTSTSVAQIVRAVGRILDAGDTAAHRRKKQSRRV